MAHRLTRRAALALAVAPLCAAQSAPKPQIVERVQRLRPRQSLRLGSADVLGEFNATARQFGLDRTGPRARDFCRKMVWAPERRSALFAGANHGVPHRLNDVWEFDLAAMAWRMLYAPDLPRGRPDGLGPDTSDVRYRDGVLLTQRGGPAIVGHTWSGLTYDAPRRRMMFMNTWPISVEPLVQRVGGDAATRYLGPPLWSFDPASGQWAIVKTPEPWPKAAVGALLEWVPELDGCIWHLNNWQLNATWLLDGQRNEWRVIANAKSSPGFAEQAPGRELVGYHDPVRRRVVAQYKRETFELDTSTRQWRRTSTGSDADGHDAHTGFYFHPASGLGLLADFRDARLHAYDPSTSRWRTIAVEGDPMPSGNHVLGYVDRALNVMVVVDDTDVWVCRPA